MKGLLTLILIAITLHSGDYLADTVWTCQIAKGCVDTLELKTNQKVIEYDCELNYRFHGSYKVFKDTLLVTVKDDSHSEDNGKVTYFRAKYKIKNESLSCISNGKLMNGKWKDESIKTGVNITYLKVKR